MVSCFDIWEAFIEVRGGLVTQPTSADRRRPARPRIFSALNSGNPREERVKVQNVQGVSRTSALYSNGGRQGPVSLFV